MKNNSIDTSTRVHARVAGVLYLIIIVFGITSEVFIRARLIVAGDAAATAQNILASSALFRAGFAADAIMLLCDVALAVLLYQLLKPVSNTLSLTAAAFRLTQAAVLGFNLLNLYAPLLILGGTVPLSSFETAQVYELASFFLSLHGNGYDLGLIFFGLSNIVLGYLVVRSDYFPSILGYGLEAAGVVYLAGSFTRFLLPEYVSLMEPVYIVPVIAELSFCLWLLGKGIRTQFR
ncbi:MAG: DUF4386 domain-containing protein [Deltaproteobacteria bacterium]|nr:DUF4386 domain-containing protein [Candidatus Zymogenaceae bacterium]